jgi:hypothetical protein
MAKKFEFGDRRYVIVKKDEIRLFEDGSPKLALFSYSRWAHFTEYFEQIDDALAKLMKADEHVKLQIHVGGAWYVSVTTGFQCVDVRRFYLALGGEIKPSKTGLAIRLTEWNRVKDIARRLKESNSKIAEAQPCWTTADHFNQEGAMACPECNPFGNWFAPSLQ